MTPAQQALERLREGNRRFVADAPRRRTDPSQARGQALVAGQRPFAIVLGCSDSRVPPEMLFDQELGDLFVVRVAGNIVSPSQAGSIEFGARQFGARLVVVLGHSQCGAVLATLDALQTPTGALSPNLCAIIDHIRPAVEGLLASELRHNRDDLERQAVHANIHASTDHLRYKCEALAQLIRDDGLLVVGAHYSLQTGVVDFFDGVTGAAAKLR